MILKEDDTTISCVQLIFMFKYQHNPPNSEDPEVFSLALVHPFNAKIPQQDIPIKDHNLGLIHVQAMPWKEAQFVSVGSIPHERSLRRLGFGSHSSWCCWWLHAFEAATPCSLALLTWKYMIYGLSECCNVRSHICFLVRHLWFPFRYCQSIMMAKLPCIRGGLCIEPNKCPWLLLPVLYPIVGVPIESWTFC